MFVNDEDLSNSTLDHAVAVLKSAPQGVVRLGIAKPIPVEQVSSLKKFISSSKYFNSLKKMKWQKITIFLIK